MLVGAHSRSIFTQYLSCIVEAEVKQLDGDLKHCVRLAVIDVEGWGGQVTLICLRFKVSIFETNVEGGK